MPMQITRLMGFVGPNIYSPQPSVVLRVQAENDQSALLRAAIKDAGQRAGLVIGYLETAAVLIDSSWIVEIQFATPMPHFGVELAQIVVEGLNARAAGNDDWDETEAFWPLQNRVRQHAPPISAVQLLAEAHQRGLPAFLRDDGLVQIGYGRRGLAFTASQSSESILWDSLDVVPIVAISGGENRAVVVQALEQRAAKTGVLVLHNATFRAARTALCDSNAAGFVFECTPNSLFQHGLPFEKCIASVICGGPLMIAGTNDEREMMHVIGLPALATEQQGRVVLDTNSPQYNALQAYIAAPTAHVDLRSNAEYAAALVWGANF